MIVATPDLPQGGSGDQSHRNEDRGGEHRWTFNRRRISDEEADVRRDAPSTCACWTRRHELHPGRARGRRLETHRQGVAQRQDARPGRTRTPGGLVRSHGQTQTLHPRYLSQGSAPDRGPSASGRFDPRHRPPAGPRPRHGQPRGRGNRIPSPAVTALPRPAEGRGPAQTPQTAQGGEGTRLWDEIAAGVAQALEPGADSATG